MSRPDKPSAAPMSGVLVLDKPAGKSSMAAVATVRRLAGGIKTGHAGTLDPLATGVLVIALGRATKIIDRLMATDKRYHTRIDLSAFTETDDLEGKPEVVTIDQPPSQAVISAALDRFRGTFLQKPPTFSAVKVGGRRAYKLARKGSPPKMTPREVTMHELELLSYDWPVVELSLHCAKGLYVRSLARELGQALGTGGHCMSIRRTAVGPFTIETAHQLDDLPEVITQQDLITIDEALSLVERAAKAHL